MKYAAARQQIRSGDLLAWSHRGWRTWYDLQLQAIRIFTRSEYVHVGVAWVVGGRVFCLEAVGAGVRIMPLSRLLPCYLVSLGVWDEAMEADALAEVGKPYSKWQAVLGGLGLLKGRDDYWQCAEYASYVLRLDVNPTPSEAVSESLRRAPLIYLEP